MQLNRESLLFKWAYLFTSKYDYPSRTSLCALFWRTFVFVPLGILCIVLPTILIVSALGHLIWQRPLVAALIIGSALLILLLAYACAWIIRVMERRRYRERFEPPEPLTAADTFIEGVIALKKKVCPIIEIR